MDFAVRTARAYVRFVCTCFRTKKVFRYTCFSPLLYDIQYSTVNASITSNGDAIVHCFGRPNKGPLNASSYINTCPIPPDTRTQAAVNRRSASPVSSRQHWSNNPSQYDNNNHYTVDTRGKSYTILTILNHYSTVRNVQDMSAFTRPHLLHDNELS